VLTLTALIQSPVEFFRSEIHEASKDLNVYLGEKLEHYIVNLMIEFINPEKMSESVGEEHILNTPLFALLQKAHEASDTAHQIKIYRCLGDTSLYVSGFFQEHFNRKLFDISYYIDMGSQAYERTSMLLQRKTDEKRVFEDLAQNFSMLVDVLAQFSDKHQSKQNDRNILAVYDRWLKSHSDRLLKILQDSGIDPVKINSKLPQ
jgi:hypothetical protein